MRQIREKKDRETLEDLAINAAADIMQNDHRATVENILEAARILLEHIRGKYP